MSVRDIERAIDALPAEQFREVRDWIVERDMKNWDKQIEDDSDGGRLDSLIERAMADYHAGRATTL